MIKNIKLMLFSLFTLIFINIINLDCAQISMEKAKVFQEVVEPNDILDAMNKNKISNVFSKEQLKDIFVKQINKIKNNYKNINDLPKSKHNSNEVLRIATYNVHNFKYCNEKPNIKSILKIIENVNPDIIILQEARYKDKYVNYIEELKKRGYKYIVFAEDRHEIGKKSNVGNMIASKIRFLGDPIAKNFINSSTKSKEHRAFAKVEIDLSKYRKSNLVIYGTHLEVNGFDRRVDEISQIINMANFDSGKNILVAADFNEVKSGRVISLLQNNGFIDSFKLAGIPAPKFTHWTGRVLDFIFLKNNRGDLVVKNSFVYYSNVSDHMMVIVDLKLN